MEPILVTSADNTVWNQLLTLTKGKHQLKVDEGVNQIYPLRDLPYKNVLLHLKKIGHEFKPHGKPVKYGQDYIYVGKAGATPVSFFVDARGNVDLIEV